MTTNSAKVLSESLGKLQITDDGGTQSKKSKTEPAESWEDEAVKSPADDSVLIRDPSSPIVDFPEAPPTSPISPSVRTKATSTGSPFQTFPPFGMNGSFEAEQNNGSSDHHIASRLDPERRPEKTTSVASRMIAAGIGQKAPRRTQEQREYDQAMKIQEKKRRDAAKEEALKSQRDKEKAQLAVWED